MFSRPRSSKAPALDLTVHVEEPGSDSNFWLAEIAPAGEKSAIGTSSTLDEALAWVAEWVRHPATGHFHDFHRDWPEAMARA